MDIYIELVYLVTLTILMLSFQMLTILLNIELSYKKTFLYSLIINYSIVMLYIDNGYYLLFIGWFITFMMLFKKQVFLYYPMFLFIYYSCIYFMQSLIQEAYIYQGILITPINYASVTLGVVAIAFVILQSMFIVYSKKKVSMNQYEFPMIITYQKKEYPCLGFLDSGNEVYYLGLPLLLLSTKIIKDYQTIDTVSVDNVGNIFIDIIKVEKVMINDQILQEVYIGMIKNIKYDCLIHKQLMGGVI